jgi:hypothetical protein
MRTARDYAAAPNATFAKQTCGKGVTQQTLIDQKRRCFQSQCANPVSVVLPGRMKRNPRPVDRDLVAAGDLLCVASAPEDSETGPIVRMRVDVLSRRMSHVNQANAWRYSSFCLRSMKCPRCRLHQLSHCFKLVFGSRLTEV